MARGSLSMCRRRAKEVAESTVQSRIKKRERQAANKEKGTPERPDFQLEPDDCGQTQEKVLTWVQVQKWLREGITKRISWSLTIPVDGEWWKPKQRRLAKDLLAKYDGDHVKKAVFYLCDNWEEMVKTGNGRFSGIPTIELLWSGRERIFSNAERGVPYVPYSRPTYRPERNADEYTEPEDDAVGHGW